MNQVIDFAQLPQLAPAEDTVLAIGVFDGVHRGHQQLLGQTVRRARALGCLSGAITFHPHPRQVLGKGNGPGSLTSLAERQQLIRAQGIDLVVTLSFTPELSQVSAAAFVDALKSYLRLRELFVGANFALGRGREGTPARLVQLGQEMGFAVHVLPRVAVDDVVVSSTAVRQALQAGDVELAARMLGRPVVLCGEVVKGAALAQKLGFPTANLRVDPDRVVPAYGVYAVRAHLEGKVLPGVANLGVRPTFDAGAPCLEVHLLDFAADLYGHSLRVEFVRRLRAEVRFPSVAELVAQVQLDIAQARAVLGAGDG